MATISVDRNVAISNIIGMDRFSAYLADEGHGALSRLAEMVGCKHSHLSKMRHNPTKRPSLALAVAIEDATGGAVPVRSWLERAPEDIQDAA